MESRQPRQAAAGAAERPPRIDSVVFARRNEVSRGRAPLSSMRRLLSAGVLAEESIGTEGSAAAAETAAEGGVEGAAEAGPEAGAGAGAGAGAEVSSPAGPGVEVSARAGAAAADDGGMLNWEVEGFLGRDGMQRQREFLGVRTRFSPWMTCSRCLAPVQIPDLATDTRFRLAASEAQAAAEDREEESVEVIAADPNLDLAALVEDEAILALPMAPAHVSCQWMSTAGPEIPSGL